MDWQQPLTYRKRFDDAAEALGYDSIEYSAGSYPALLWALEKDFLRTVVADARQVVEKINYLDFACGSGRVLSFMEPMVDHATGVEVAKPMLDLAAKKVKDSTLIQADITADAEALRDKFDLITTFRFVLNAEPDLRRSALKRLAELLRDERSVLVFNNHINLWSYKLPTWPVQRMTPPSRLPPCSGNFLTTRSIRRLTAECGLRVERVYGCGFLSRRALRFIPYDKLEKMERRLAHVHLLQPLGVDQIYIARRLP